MPIDEDQLAKIRKLNRSAVESMVVELYPQLYRIAAGLTGQEDVATGTLRFLLRQSIDVMPKWKDEDTPQRYYLHHLILLVRRARKHPPELRQDLLIDRSVDSAEYRAFLTGLRKLHFQQQEAFILAQGEKLNARYIAVAMDCSIQAATNHLKAAEDAPLEESGQPAAENCKVNCRGKFREISAVRIMGRIAAGFEAGESPLQADALSSHLRIPSNLAGELLHCLVQARLLNETLHSPPGFTPALASLQSPGCCVVRNTWPTGAAQAFTNGPA